jgi:hypothetical protein
VQGNRNRFRQYTLTQIQGVRPQQLCRWVSWKVEKPTSPENRWLIGVTVPVKTRDVTVEHVPLQEGYLVVFVLSRNKAPSRCDPLRRVKISVPTVTIGVKQSRRRQRFAFVLSRGYTCLCRKGDVY